MLVESGGQFFLNRSICQQVALVGCVEVSLSLFMKQDDGLQTTIVCIYDELTGALISHKGTC